MSRLVSRSRLTVPDLNAVSSDDTSGGDRRLGAPKARLADTTKL
ncbi:MULTISPECIES: hypothetical protein [Rhodococcus]|nr:MULTISPECIES: hypothetical protein [Rhodococcus]